MAKESEEPEGLSGDAAQSSQGKQPRLSTVPSQWGKKLQQKCKAAWQWYKDKEWMGKFRLPDEIVEMVISGIAAFGHALLLLFGASGFVVLSYVCSYEGVSMVWNDIKTHAGVPADDILPLEGFGVGAVFGICFFVVCGREFARLIQSPLERLLVSSTWFWVLLALCGTLVLASSLAISLCSVGWRPQRSWSWIWRVLLLGLCVSTLSVVLRLFWRPTKEWMGGLPLFVAIAIWAVLGIGAFLLAMWWLGRVPFWQLKLDPEENAESIVKIALTLVGGVGAVAYLVIKYRERQQAGRDEERERDRFINAKMQQAVDQLGSDKASTRIAGVHALTDIADNTRIGDYRQHVVDILCGYLRSDRTEYALDEFGNTVKDDFGHLVKSGDSDKVVESTIIAVMRDHLRKERKDANKWPVRQVVRNELLWCSCVFDLHGATFHEDVDLTGAAFDRTSDFHGIKFEGDADFHSAAFTGYADFHGTTFKNKVDFHSAAFTGYAYLNSAAFIGYADFHSATFKNKVDFHSATFKNKVDFNSATFSKIYGPPSFGECKFNRKFRGTIAYWWGPIPIPEDNDGLPAGAAWTDFPEEGDKDGGTANR